MTSKFAMKDMGDLSYFLGIVATRDEKGLFLSQRQYALELLDMANMSNCNPCKTPADTQSKMDHTGSPVSDPYDLSQYGGWTSVPHIYPSRLILCCETNMFFHARSERTIL